MKNDKLNNQSFDLETVPQKWPDLWVRILYKTYPRFPRVKLVPDGKNLLARKSLWETLRNRASADGFSGKSLSLKDISNLIYYSAGLSPSGPERRFYPSGGARYPLEIYPVLLRVRDIKRGIYHYNIKDNVLELMPSGDIKNVAKKLCYDWTRWNNVSMFLIITAVFSRTKIKYGEERGHKLTLLEAGFLGQNVYLVSTALGLECRAMGSFLDDEFVVNLLDIEGINERPVYALAIGAA